METKKEVVLEAGKAISWETMSGSVWTIFVMEPAAGKPGRGRLNRVEKGGHSESFGVVGFAVGRLVVGNAFMFTHGGEVSCTGRIKNFQRTLTVVRFA